MTAPTTDVAHAPARQADRLYHDLLSPPEVLAVRERVRRAAETIVAPVAGRLARQDERTGGFPHDVFDALAREGLFRIPFDEDVGGDGLAHPAAATAAAIEELAYHSNSVAAVVDVHAILAGHALDHGSTAQRERWLRPAVAGELIGAFATSEPGASSDLSPTAVLTEARPDGDGWMLRGRKRWITNAVAAEFIVVLARTGSVLSTFVVPTGTPGLRVGTPDRKLGNRAQITADVVLDDVRLGPEALLGYEGQGLKIALQTLTYGRIGIAAAGVGMAQAAFDHTVHRLISRVAFGAPLAGSQHWQFRMAEYATRLQIARDLYLKAALRLDGGVPFPEPEAAMAKFTGTELAVEMARDAVQAHGAIGFTAQLGTDDTECPVEAIYRDSKIGEIYEGANEIQKWVIARSIFGRDHTG